MRLFKKYCHPIFTWLFGLFSSTVKVLLSNKTPCLAQSVNVLLLFWQWNSLWISLKILINDLGGN